MTATLISGAAEIAIFCLAGGMLSLFWLITQPRTTPRCVTGARVVLSALLIGAAGAIWYLQPLP